MSRMIHFEESDGIAQRKFPISTFMTSHKQLADWISTFLIFKKKKKKKAAIVLMYLHETCEALSYSPGPTRKNNNNF